MALNHEVVDLLFVAHVHNPIAVVDLLRQLIAASVDHSPVNPSASI